MKLTVLLGASQEASFDITLYDNSFTQRWVEELRWCLSNSTIYQVESFSPQYTLDESRDLLINSCEIINRYIENFIEIRPNIKQQPQEYFNYLHNKFEQLSGTWENPTRLFTIANQELKTAIRYLNLFVHKVEEQLDHPTGLDIKFNKENLRRQEIISSDYDFFEFNSAPGTLFLHYAELGKEFIDLYEDNLPIDYAAFTNQHHYTGEASISFFEYNAFSRPGYIEWLQSHGINPYNKTLGHGKIPLGIVDNLEDAISKINNYRHIDNILIKE